MLRAKERDGLSLLLLEPGAGLPHFTWGLFLLFIARDASFLIAKPSHSSSHYAKLIDRSQETAQRRRLYNIVLLPRQTSRGGSHIAQGKSHKQVAGSSSSATPFGEWGNRISRCKEENSGHFPRISIFFGEFDVHGIHVHYELFLLP